MFVNVAAGDLHLLPTSPCVNAGLNQGWMTDSTDLDGNPRISGGVVDMGAFELPVGPTVLVERLMAQVESSWPRSQPLIGTLSAALRSIERGNFVAAVNQLQAFQNKVRAQVSRSDPALAASFVGVAQEVIAVLHGEAHGR